MTESVRRPRVRGEEGRRGRRAVAGPGEAAEQLAELVEELVALLEAGVTPTAAWGYVREFSAHPLVVRAVVRIEAGERVADALVAASAASVDATSAVRAGTLAPPRRARSRSPDDASGRVLAAAWHVAVAAGAPLAPTLRTIADALRDRAETERDIAIALAGPRATARLVSWLPLVGMALAVVMGVDLLGTLTGSVVGWALLGSGTLLLLLGRRWMRALLHRASPGSDLPGLRHDLLAVALSGGLGVPSALALCDEACVTHPVLEDDRASVARILSLAQRAGAPAVDLLRSAAAQARRRRRMQGRSDAAALAVRSMVPLGVCVLPSFMLLGVAPVVLSIVSSTVSAF